MRRQRENRITQFEDFSGQSPLDRFRSTENLNAPVIPRHLTNRGHPAIGRKHNVGTQRSWEKSPANGDGMEGKNKARQSKLPRKRSVPKKLLGF
jgi:hypothetical protein